MMVIRFKSHEDADGLLKKVKRMKKFAEELEDIVEECIDQEEAEYRDGRYRREYDEDDMRSEGRYGYRRGGRGRM